MLFDFGASDLKIYDKAPHMIQPTIRPNEIEKGRYCLSWLQTEMENRLEKKDLFDARSFAKEIKKWPSIVCVIDEFPIFVRKLTSEKKDKKAYTIIEDILARARKIKIHLVLAAQNASKGNIQIENTNLAAGMAFRCTNWHDSYAIIGTSDAVNLSGQGAMCFRYGQFEGIKRMQGAFMDPAEIEDALDEIDFAQNHDEKQYNEAKFQFNMTLKSENLEKDYNSFSIQDEDEKLLLDIVMWMQDKERISNNQLKHNFEMGYDRANRFLVRLEDAGLISVLRKGTKLQRVVYPDKAKEFLRDHGYVEDVNKEKWVKCLDPSSMKNDMELKQEKTIKANDEEMDEEDHVEDSFHEEPKKRKKTIAQDGLKNTSTRYSKKGPAH